MNVYIAATRQNDGKTMVSLGLFNLLGKKVKNIGYMKPVGQQFKIINGRKIDKDAVLMSKIYGLESDLMHMNPIAIPPGFTEKHILQGDCFSLRKKVRHDYDVLSQKRDFVLIEGTGHAGVGSVFDMSNADVAKQLGAKVIIVSSGGIGKPIDEIMLNHTKFESQGVEVLGVIVNKVRKDKYQKINHLVRKGLARKKINVFGVIPFENVLSNPTMSELMEDLGGELICGEKKLSNVVERFVIGDMVAHEILEFLSGGTLLITSGNREDFIFSALSGWVLHCAGKYSISGIVATYGKKPPQKVIEVIEKYDIPLLVVKEDSFHTASLISNMIFKLRAEDKTKIRETQDLIEKYVDVDRIYNMLKKSSKKRGI